MAMAHRAGRAPPESSEDPVMTGLLALDDEGQQRALAAVAPAGHREQQRADRHNKQPETT